MANIAITNTLIATLNTDQTSTFHAADEGTNDTAQTRAYTPTGKDNKILIGMQNATGHGALTFAITAGVGVFGAVSKTGSVAAGATEVIQIETGKYMLANGTITIAFTPANGKDLTNDHALKVWVIELQ